jgi:peptidoglycan/xylan/chitin deacetylase (PgdA/CDA1 family)
VNRALLRAVAVHGCRGVGALALAERALAGQLSLLTYHRVLPPDRQRRYFNPGLAVTPEALRVHCGVLRERYEVLPLREAVEQWRRGGHDGRPLAAITFDDGYRDNFRLAAPVLAELGLRATFFVVAGLVGTNRPPWYDRMARAVERLRDRREPLSAEHPLHAILRAAGNGRDMPGAASVIAAAKSLRPDERQAFLERIQSAAPDPAAWEDDDLIMDWPQLRQLAGAGHEIGSHSHTHEILPLLDDAALHREVAGARRCIEEHLGASVWSFCYPNGDADERVANAVMSAGYGCATTTLSGSNRPGQDVYRLRRRFIHEDRLTGCGGRVTSRLLLRAELCGLADRVFRRH